MGRISRSFLFGLAAALATASAGLAAPESITVELNDSKPVGLYGTAANVVIGDPAVADVSMINTHTLVVIGRGYGRTHLTVLDANGRTLLDTRVFVVEPNDGRVTLYRGTASSNFTCSPRCQAAAAPSEAAPAAAPPASSPAPTHGMVP